MSGSSSDPSAGTPDGRPEGSPPTPAGATAAALPEWARDLVPLYESGAHSQFILHGNVQDVFLVPRPHGFAADSLKRFLLETLLVNHEVVLSYDLGDGVRIEKGVDPFRDWTAWRQKPELPRAPRAAIDFLTRYFRYLSNLGRLGRARTPVACVLEDAHLVAPAEAGTANHEQNALALQIREWASDPLLTEHPLVTFLLSENLNDLHPIVASNPRAAQVRIPLPGEPEIAQALQAGASSWSTALGAFPSTAEAARQLRGATLASIHALLKTYAHHGRPIRDADLSEQKKQLVERDSRNLIEFVESRRTLDDLHGLDAVKAWLRQDIQLWRQGEIDALPKGYLFCGPVGTGKTFLVECLAGEAGIPVVKIRNFRDKWVGSTEGNLEAIFRLIQALGRCYVFVDEADQALGRRESGQGDSGLSGRVYAMIAEEMGSSRTRGKVVWILASSRPDLIEVDLKRPGRLDVKIPLLPTATTAESLGLLRTLLQRRGLVLEDEAAEGLRERMPLLLTPGAAEALAVKIYRAVKTANLPAAAAAKTALEDYQHPVPLDVLRFQIEIAVREATDPSFIPAAFRGGDVPENSARRG